AAVVDPFLGRELGRGGPEPERRDEHGSPHSFSCLGNAERGVGRSTRPGKPLTPAVRPVCGKLSQGRRPVSAPTGTSRACAGAIGGGGRARARPATRSRRSRRARG